jgi:hypothetical protein
MTDPKEYAASVERYNAAQKQRNIRNDVLEEAAKVAERAQHGLYFTAGEIELAKAIADDIRSMKERYNALRP